MITVRAINGIYNRSGNGGGAQAADPQFYPLLDALRRLQQLDVVSLRLENRGAEQVMPSLDPHPVVSITAC
jgi:hypothetical protein